MFMSEEKYRNFKPKRKAMIYIAVPFHQGTYCNIDVSKLKLKLLSATFSIQEI